MAPQALLPTWARLRNIKFNQESTASLRPPSPPGPAFVWRRLRRGSLLYPSGSPGQTLAFPPLLLSSVYPFDSLLCPHSAGVFRTYRIITQNKIALVRRACCERSGGLVPDCSVDVHLGCSLSLFQGQPGPALGQCPIEPAGFYFDLPRLLDSGISTVSPFQWAG